jgi:ABC-type proline/glycine betaine transport system ATPase subunit
MYLVDKNRDVQKVVSGKDIVVIMGVSGAGKSTLVQMMLGYKQVLKKSILNRN